MSLLTKVCLVVLGSLFAFILDINESVSKLYASFYGTCLSLLLFHEQFEQICHIIKTVLLYYSAWLLPSKHIAFRYCDTIRDIMSCHQIDDPKQFCAFCIHNYFMVSFIISGKFDTLNLTRLHSQ